MQKTLVFLSALLLIPLLSASQIVITSDEILGIGDEVVQAFDNSPDPTVVPGDPGENIFWDFSALFADEIDTLNFMDPASTQIGRASCRKRV
jgi:hypothetical protein